MDEINELVRYCADFIGDYWVDDVDDAVPSATSAGIVTAMRYALGFPGSNNADTDATSAWRSYSR